MPELLGLETEPQLSGPTVDPVDRSPPEADRARSRRRNAGGPCRRGDLASTGRRSCARSDPGSRELECLAVGIYFESKSEPLAGQLAVGQVIANRANSRPLPVDPIAACCSSAANSRSSAAARCRRSPRSSRQWQNAVAIAKIVDQELQASPVGKALFFHARRVSPRWRLKRVASIGNHIFYR